MSQAFSTSSLVALWQEGQAQQRVSEPMVDADGSSVLANGPFDADSMGARPSSVSGEPNSILHGDIALDRKSVVATQVL
jgi:hypothetical protein